MTTAEWVWAGLAGLAWIVIGLGFVAEAARRRRGTRLVPVGKGFFYAALPMVLVAYLFLVYLLVLLFVGVPGRAMGAEGGLLAGAPENLRSILSFLAVVVLIAGLVYFLFAAPPRLVPLLARRHLEVDEESIRLVAGSAGEAVLVLPLSPPPTVSVYAGVESAGLLAPGILEREIVEVRAPQAARIVVSLAPDEATPTGLPAWDGPDADVLRIYRSGDQAFFRWVLTTYTSYRDAP